MKKIIFVLVSLLSTTNAAFAQVGKKIIIGKNVVFTTSAACDTFSWQEDKNDGAGWTTVVNDGKYSGQGTNKFEIKVVSGDMNGYKYHCNARMATLNHGIKDFNAGIVDSLFVTTSISSGQSIYVVGTSVTLTSDAATGPYCWYFDGETSTGKIAGATSKTYSFTQNSTRNEGRYKCKVGEGVSELFSSELTVVTTGAISVFPKEVTINDKNVFLCVHHSDSNLYYKWYVLPPNSGDQFIDITVADSDYYSGFNKDTLTIKNAISVLNGSKFKCEIYKKGSFYVESEAKELIINGKIARYDNQNRLQFTGAVYSGLQGIKDDNAANLTQIYFRANIFRKTAGLDINADSKKRTIWFRNLFLQGTVSTNVENIKYYNVGNASFSKQDTATLRGVNKLDLLKNANLNFNFMLPVWTRICSAYKPHYGDKLHLYIEPFSALLLSTVASSNAKDTVNIMHVTSLQWGLAMGMRFEDLKLAGSQIFFELTGKIFYINSLASDKINTDLSYMQSSVGTNYTPGVSKGLLNKTNNPYYNVDALVWYNTSNTGNSNVFLHFSLFSNIVGKSFSQVQNGYYQLQGGYALDLGSFWKKLQKS